MSAGLADYLDLRIAVADHVKNRTISEVFPRLVLTAEALLNQELRHTLQITLFVPPPPLNLGNPIPLPDDFLEAASVQDSFGNELPGTSLGPDNVWTQNVIAKIYYYAALPTLTTTPTTTNWLLDRFPNVYIYATAFEAAKFLRDAELAKTFYATMPNGKRMGLLADELKRLKIDDDRHRFGLSVTRVQGDIV